jgi:coenzyme PQQ precursor peptide PqqA
MSWSKPDFVEITLNMEVTAYVNTEDGVDAAGLATLRRSVAGPSQRFSEASLNRADQRGDE